MSKGIMFLLGICLVSISHAIPSNCPSVAQIQSVGLSVNLVRDNNGKWYAGRTAEHYGTLELWTFVIGQISAANSAGALDEAYEGLSTLVYKFGPVKGPANKWGCIYDNDQGYVSGAITPPVNSP